MYIMLKPAFTTSTEQIELHGPAQPNTTQPAKTAARTTCDGQISFKGLGGEDAACQRLLLNIATSHVTLTSIDKIKTSCIFPEGTIFYTVSGTVSEIADFRRLAGQR
jgi:hypothetical protein